ncbi:hypothetical protein QBC34DRAFT_440949 [Podospora aff. communis PSN243]|uniref:Heterokaryon incompatibility domain-containing protein n=1 Tax=Podospora aff. communis PSN243 TaxID=3040156 RepID=A0AAV9GGM4_9PEZI|nr:hypothetical protein QBC34DRAFT_440949 [Podospora aff. communis PSN243]
MASLVPPVRYVYFPLTGGSGSDVFSVRLLHLLPSTDPESQLRCHLIETAVPTGKCTDVPGAEYYALSYTWGDPVFPETLEVVVEGNMKGGQGPARQAGLIQITENLQTALLSLRNPDKTLVLWVDAIYSQAASVIVWLGRDSHAHGHEVSCLSFFKELAGLVAEYETNRRDNLEWVTGWRKRLNINKTVTDFMRGSGRDSLEWFLDQPWFRRRWIIQEVVLAKDVVVYCGSWSIPWTTLETSMQELFSHRMESFTEKQLTNMQTVSRMRDRKVNNPKRLGPLDVLLRFAHFDCADPRDRIYALYGIFQQGVTEPSRWGPIGNIDYTLSTEDVFINFTASLIQKGYGNNEPYRYSSALIYLLQLAAAFRPRHAGAHLSSGQRRTIPSWVVDWTGALYLEPLRDSFYVPGIWDALSWDTREAAKVTQHEDKGKVLEIAGITWDAIIAVIPIDAKAFNNVSDCAHLAKAAMTDFLHKFVRELDSTSFPTTMKGNHYLYSSEHLVMVIARSLVAAWLFVPANSYFSQDPKFRVEFLNKLKYSTFNLPEILHKWTAYVELVALTMRGRSLFMTNGGLIGIAADDSHVGDEVCLFEGSYTPFIIRPQTGQPNTKSGDQAAGHAVLLISDAYIGLAPAKGESTDRPGSAFSGTKSLTSTWQSRQRVTFHIL